MLIKPVISEKHVSDRHFDALKMGAASHLASIKNIPMATNAASHAVARLH